MDKFLDKIKLEKTHSFEDKLSSPEKEQLSLTKLHPRKLPKINIRSQSVIETPQQRVVFIKEDS